jgi:Flp pilus assembly protein TadD
LARLSELETQHPNHPLVAEVSLSRTEWLVLTGRYTEAAVLILANLENPALRGKKAELLHLLGDVRLHQGKNAEACEAFRRALGLGLSGDRAEAARKGLQRCGTAR